MQTQPRPDYGIDAPGVIRNLLLIGVFLLVLGTFVEVIDIGPVRLGIRSMAWTGSGICMINAAAMLYGSRIGKMRTRDRLLDLISWKGTETVLDVGCGRGLMLLGAAKRLTTGKAIGLDKWQSEDLSNNRPEATLENAKREGVADRVEVQTGDARQLPFPDKHFDVIVSNWALHNIYKAEERQQAVREIARVLKPGGQVVLSDIRFVGEYAKVLEDSGLTNVCQSTSSKVFSLVVTMFTWGSVRPYRVTGQKPAT